MFYDAPTKNYVLFAPLRPETGWVRAMGDSVGQQRRPWRGYKRFHYEITRAGFADAIATLQRKYPTSGLSTYTQDYEIESHFHLNAETVSLARFGGARLVHEGLSCRDKSGTKTDGETTP